MGRADPEWTVFTMTVEQVGSRGGKAMVASPAARLAAPTWRPKWSPQTATSPA